MITLNEHLQAHDSQLSALLNDLVAACKTISAVVNRAGLLDILGAAGVTSHQGDEVKKLDLVAHDIIVDMLGHGGQVCVMGSEEVEGPVFVDGDGPRGEWVLLFDPLDGSSNIDANVSIGTIFSVFRRLGGDGDGTLEDLLQPGSAQVAAGYVIYGSSTILVYTTGERVDGFTLDAESGQFILSHPEIRTPAQGQIYSANEARARTWHPNTRQYIESCKDRGCTCRYIGSLVADFHRNLLYGGVFLYPADHSDPDDVKPKLRLMYEGNPLAFVSEAAGGGGTTGSGRILEVAPTDLHQRVPLILGGAEEIAEYDSLFSA